VRYAHSAIETSPITSEATESGRLDAKSLLRSRPPAATQRPINAALSWIRDHRREQPAEIAEDALVEAHPGPARIASGEDGVRLRAAIAQLPPKQKMVLELRVFDDLSFKEVASLADCTENTAKVNFHYAVKRLRDILGSDHG